MALPEDSNPVPTSVSPALTEAFELALSKPVRLDNRPADGWCFGKPPGIAAEQWPLSPVNGAPLRHAFTVKLPAQYRVQRPDWVAISVFVDEMHQPMGKDPAGSGMAVPDKDERRFDMAHWDTTVVAFWLTEAQFTGPLGSPPTARHGKPLKTPGWLTRSPMDYFGEYGLPSTAMDKHKDTGFDPGGYAVRALLEAQQPRRGWAVLPALEALEYGFPISLSVREDDPNVGRPAREWEEENVGSGYVPAYTDEGTALNLERFEYFDAHLGGTMFPAQGYPDFSPFYLEFSEVFGGFAFGGGVAQLDLKTMQITWAA